MEVHHHSHTAEPDIHRGRKKWTHYFWEFFMLFLAVTLGFFVENQREHYIEHQREKQYARELYSEFLGDSIVVAGKVKVRLEKEKDMDWLIGYFQDSSLTVLPRSFYPAYTTVMYLANTYSFEPKDGILSQLRNSGTLRYFQDEKLQKFFGDISVCINNVRIRNEQEYQFFASPVKPFILKHFDFGWTNKLRSMDEDPGAPMLAIINRYRQGDKIIDGKILGLSSFEREEAINIISFYKQMLISTRTLQMNEYIKANHKLLEKLRSSYKIN